MRILSLALVLSFFIPLNISPAEAKSRNWRDCESDSAKRAMRGCSRIIRRGRDSHYNLSVAYNNRGNVYFNKGNYEKAIADYDKAIGHNKKHPDAYSNRGTSYSKLGQERDAIADYNRAIKQFPKNGMNYFRRADSHSAIREHDRAIADYDRAIDLISIHQRATLGGENRACLPCVYNNRANNFIAMGRFVRAIADFDQAISLDPQQHANFYGNRGDAYAKLDRLDLAKKDYLYALQLLRPKLQTSPTANDRASIAYLWKQLGQPKKGLLHALIALEQTPEDFNTWDTLGGIYEAMGKTEKAIEAFRKAIKLDPIHKTGVKHLKEAETRGLY